MKNTKKRTWKNRTKKIISVMLVMLFLFCTSCGTTSDDQKHVLTILNLDDSKIDEFLQIATDAFEKPEVVQLRKDALEVNGSEMQVPKCINAVEWIQPAFHEKDAEVHFYIMTFEANYLVKERQEGDLSMNIVYDCDTGLTYYSYDYPQEHANEEEYSKEYYINIALSDDILRSKLPDDFLIFADNESHGKLTDEQLAKFNEEFHPAGWEYAPERIVELDENGNPIGDGSSDTSNDTVTGDMSNSADSETSGEMSNDAGSETSTDMGTGTDDGTNSEKMLESSERVEIAADAIRKGIEDDSFAENELIDDTVLAAKEYSIVIQGETTFRMHLIYVWMNGNVDVLDEYAGEVLINVDTGDTLYRADYDESKIGFDDPDGLMYYYLWMGPVARAESGYVMNDEETLISFSEEEISEIQSKIKE